MNVIWKIIYLIINTMFLSLITKYCITYFSISEYVVSGLLFVLIIHTLEEIIKNISSILK